MNKENTNILRVASKSSVPAVAGSIIKSIEENKDVELHAIGAGSVNQSVKAIASARGMIAPKGYNALTSIGFGETEINGETRTMMKFRLILQ